MSTAAPNVDVVMPVLNALPYLDAAISSIVGQTNQNFCLKIYDDCSTDGSYERALEWATEDPRIEVHRGTVRLGPGASSQAAAALATTELVARMDADDLAHPERLELEAAALQARPDAVLIGSTFELIDSDGRVIRNAQSCSISGSAPPFGHGSIMYRNSAFQAAGGYRRETDYFEDLDLYRRLAMQGDLLVLNRPLLQMRFAGQNARLRDEKLAVLDRIDRQYPGRAQRQLHRRNILPVSFYSMAVLSILARERPGLLGLMARHAYRRNVGSLVAATVIIAIAEIWPRLARSISFGINGLREFQGARGFVPGAIYRWRFPHASEATPEIGLTQPATA